MGSLLFVPASNGENTGAPPYFRQEEISYFPRMNLHETPFDLQIFSNCSPNFSECVASVFSFG